MHSWPTSILHFAPGDLSVCTSLGLLLISVSQVNLPSGNLVHGSWAKDERRYGGVYSLDLFPERLPRLPEPSGRRLCSLQMPSLHSLSFPRSLSAGPGLVMTPSSLLSPLAPTPEEAPVRATYPHNPSLPSVFHQNFNEHSKNINTFMY